MLGLEKHASANGPLDPHKMGSRCLEAYLLIRLTEMRGLNEPRRM